MKTCPCGSQKSYEECCGLYIEQQQLPPTPEALMRSRYTAYSQANIAYIKDSMRGKPLLGFNEQDVKKWASKVSWQGLKVIDSRLHPDNSDIGFVEFIASLCSGNKNEAIHERSEFQKHEGKWFYTNALRPQFSKPANIRKIARNAACPCGSEKKYKNCHAQKN